MPESAPERELLEKLRRSLDLRLSAQGEFLIDSQAVTHPRITTFLLEHLDLDDDGETIVRAGTQIAYVSCDDLPLRAQALRRNKDGFELRLDDKRWVSLRPQELWEEPGKGLRCLAPSQPSGRALPVRFNNRAAMDLAQWIEEIDGRTFLATTLGHHPIPQHPPASKNENPDNPLP